jgi:hypothetical protein
VTLQEYFSYQSLVIYLFSNPAHKTKTGIASRWQTSNSKPPGQIIKIGQNREGAAINPAYLTRFKINNVGV